MSYVILKLDSDGFYSYKDADTIAMSILGCFLSSDVRCRTTGGFRSWFYNDALEGADGNITSLDKEGNDIVLTDLYSEEENPTELRMPRDQFIKLLDEWLDVVCVKKPAEVIITEVNGEFVLETKT
jgi:hypothetical protein